MSVPSHSIKTFQAEIKAFGKANFRSMPWREDLNPYAIVVSELMLQQTQVSRVIPKFQSFLVQFPDIKSLAAADQATVITAWSGLGYNRRARFLHQTAIKLLHAHNATVPNDRQVLESLPGVGPNTAAAIRVYAYNEPAAFIETNIRSVFIDWFFKTQETVSDAELMPLIENAIDKTNPRAWCWALMDYGAWLKSQKPNPSRKSSSHNKQSKFEGSKRQLRGKILRRLSAGGVKRANLATELKDDRLDEVLTALQKEKLVFKDDRSGQLRL